LESIATTHNATITQTALNYLLQKPGVSSVLLGIKTPAQMADNLKTSDWQMLPDEVSLLDIVSMPAPIYPHNYLESGPKD